MSEPYIGYREREDDDEPTCGRCEAPESWCRCLPIDICPQCGEEHEDIAGFGLLYCDACGFCVCAVVNNGRCDKCGRTVSDAA